MPTSKPPGRRPITATAAAGLALTLLLGVPGTLAGQQGEETEASGDSTATLTGRVVSAMTGGPLEQARVVLGRSGRGAFTDSAGAFTIRDAPAGRDTVQVSLIGFAEEQVPLTLKPGHVTRVTLMLSQTVLRVEDISVEVRRQNRRGKLAGFWSRQERGIGAFLTPEEIEEKNPSNPSDLLRGVAGVEVGASRLGRASIRVTRARLNCDPIFYVDGLRRRGFHLDEMNEEDIMAMEIYRGPSEVPVQYKSNARGCGVIMVWTQSAEDRRTGGP